MVGHIDVDHGVGVVFVQDHGQSIVENDICYTGSRILIFTAIFFNQGDAARAGSGRTEQRWFLRPGSGGTCSQAARKSDEQYGDPFFDHARSWFWLSAEN